MREDFFESARAHWARDPAMGACGGVMNLFMEDFPNPPAIVGGILESECRDALARFFRDLRGTGK